MEYRKSRYTTWTLLIIGAVSLLVSLFFLKLLIVFLVLLALGVTLIAVAFLIQYKYWRCPYCGQHLPVRHFEIFYCPFCSNELE